ncbi:hypothetical protein ELS19_19335 [Halogeometricum borinquense]|uniref:Uncharacterized protein n=1 Tax=Halogeometricum borinquense TaxID=60847 RepID=A0A482T9K7_9EURY|nr:hypothetical protein [Halogeometricum borinquense]RYJ08639.1 hypothetical protein ELS19_19335 [Halogeometricum borinquense]
MQSGISLPGIRSIAKEAYSGWVFTWTALTHGRGIGTNIFEEDWDCAIVLDACRVDALKAVADEYDFLGEIGSNISVGSTSKEWMFNTFTAAHKGEIAETTYITDNTFSRDIELEPEGCSTMSKQRKHISASIAM